MSNSTSGQKRKLEETDIPIDGDIPSKQQKLMSNEDTTNTSINTEEKEKQQQKEELDQDTFSKLKTQIEYYFGDSNLPLDKHILQTSKMGINKGFFPISGLLTFKMIQPLTQSVDAIIKVIESSSKLQLNDSKTGVRRHPDCGVPPTKEQIYQRTIFAKGFHPRTTLNQLSMFWKQQCVGNETNNVLSVRTMKESVSVGIAENNKPKIVRSFLGTCSVELSSIELANELSKMIFSSNGRVIRCGMFESYLRDDIEWKIKKRYYPFESNKILFIREIPTHSTYRDIKNWICNALYSRIKKKNSLNKVEFVYKELNSGIAYARFSTESDIVNCVKWMKKKALMGIHPKLVVLNDSQASKVWNKLAQKPLNANEDVEIIVMNQKKRDKEEENKDKDEDIDIKIDNESDTKDNKKHKLEETSSPQPQKKQKT